MRRSPALRREKRGGQSCWGGGAGYIQGSYLRTGGRMMDSPLNREIQVLLLRVLAKHIDPAILKGAYPSRLPRCHNKVDGCAKCHRYVTPIWWKLGEGWSMRFTCKYNTCPANQRHERRLRQPHLREGEWSVGVQDSAPPHHYSTTTTNHQPQP